MSDAIKFVIAFVTGGGLSAVFTYLGKVGRNKVDSEALYAKYSEKLINRNDKLTADREKLSFQVTQLEQQVAELKESNGILTRSNDQLTNSNRQLDKQVKQLTSSNRALVKKVDQMSAQLAKLSQLEKKEIKGDEENEKQ